MASPQNLTRGVRAQRVSDMMEVLLKGAKTEVENKSKAEDALRAGMIKRLAKDLRSLGLKNTSNKTVAGVTNY